MKYVVDRYEVWMQGVFVDADSPEEAIEKVENGDGEDIESWFGLSSRESHPVVANVVPFDPEKHELPYDHPYRKYIDLPARKMIEELKAQGVKVEELRASVPDPDDLLGMPRLKDDE